MTKVYTVKIHHQGVIHTLEVPDNQTVLKAADGCGLHLPSSCNAGVCTTCAAQLLSGTVEQGDGMGLSSELKEQGYALLCVSYPRSDLVLETEKEETVYHLQFGQFQSS
ncbi:MAG: 2Fe-2S iron-sulfur cluster-binding protein [Cyanobacteria bacterium LVE1205-1]|jgi:ferredoxin